MPGTRNTYIEGIDKDTSYEKYSNKNYFHARNFKVTADEELSTGSLETEAGNKLKFKVPQIHPAKVMNEGFLPSGGDNNAVISINGHDETGVSITDLRSVKRNIENLFASEIDNGDFTVLIEDDDLYIIGLDTGLSAFIGDSLSNPSWGGILSQYYGEEINLKICGWGTLNDEVILLTTSSVSKEPDTYSQIWKFKYDPNSNEIEGIDNNDYLRPSKHLVVNNKADLSLYHRVGEVHGVYENKELGRIYFTDNYNPPRSFNVYDPKSYIVPASNMNIRSDVQFSQPLVESIDSGSLPVGSTVQYTYRFRDSTEGSETTFAPLSNQIKLTEFDPNSDSYQNYSGAFEGEAEDKSVTYRIPTIDNDFDVIEHILIIYERENTPQIWKFDEEFIGGQQSITVTNSEIPSDAIQITQQEFNNIGTEIIRTKSMAIKDNYLILGNNTEAPFDPDFDARAYRFNSNQKARIYSIEEIPTKLQTSEFEIDGSSSSPNWNVPEDADAINPYNYDDNLWDYSTNFLHDFQENIDYKYQSDGSTLGGEGPNISYEFVTKSLTGNITGYDNSNTSGPPYIDVVRTSSPQDDLQIVDNEGNEIQYNINNEFHSQKSPIIGSIFKGHARGEVYRYGIVFYRKSGSPSYVKWIGDIRMPFGFEYPFCNGNRNEILGIQFNVDVSSIKDEISGFQIVRVERSPSEMSRIETGLTMPMKYIDATNSSNFGTQVEREVGIKDPRSYIVPISRDTYQTNWNTLGIYSGAIGHFDIDNEYYQNIDYAEFEAGSEYRVFSEEAVTPNSATQLSKFYPLDLSYSSIKGSSNRNQRIDINDYKAFDTSESVSGIGGSYPVLNKSWIQSGDIEPAAPTSKGDKKIIINYSLNPGEYWGEQLIGLSDRSSFYITLGRKRDTFLNQYGGDSYEDRSNQKYILAGEFQIVTTQNGSQFNFNTYGGDIYDYYYDLVTCVRNVDKSDLADGEVRITNAFTHSLESPINIGLRDKSESFNNFAREGYISASSTGELYSNTKINPIYLQERTAREVFRTKDVFGNTVQENPQQIRASRQKIYGELVDSWRKFPPAQIIDVEGVRGPINKIINFKDRVYFFQDSGIGAVSINERAAVQSEQGTELVLGYGGILDDYRYVSTETGTVHKFSVTNSGAAIFYFDALNKKLMRFGRNGNSPISDIKGLHSFFRRKVEGHIENTDQTIMEYIYDPNDDLHRVPIGIHSVFDRKNNRVFFTFLNGELQFDPNSTVEGEIEYKWNSDNFTVSYSEQLGAFESFYDFTPSLYLSHRHKVYSINPDKNKEGYEHEEGPYGTYYGKTYPSTINFIVNDKANIPKIFNNLELNAESYRANGDDIWDDIIDRVEVYNEYQDSGEVPLVIDHNIKRRFRKWRLYLPRDNDRDSLSPIIGKPNNQRIRGPWCHIKFIYENEDNNRFLLHDVETYFKQKPY